MVTEPPTCWKPEVFGDLVNIMNTQLEKMVEWLRAIKLSLHMFFVLTKKNGNCDNQVNIARVSQSRVYSTRFLGVIIDRYLKWTDYLNHVQSKVSKGIRILCKARKVLLPPTLFTMYDSLIYPYLIYCIEVWGSACKNILMPLIRLQQKSTTELLTPTEPLLNLLKMLPINSIYEYAVCTFRSSGAIFLL